MTIVFAIAVLLCALVPAALFLRNLQLYVEPAAANGAVPPVSILIPARNEADGIGDAVRTALRSSLVEFEIVVMDDGSTDGTDAIVLALAADDHRVRLDRAPALPPGWNGKQHACWQLAKAARFPTLCFVDADVRLAPECVSRMAALLDRGENGLVSGFPRQITGTWLEWMLLPLIHFVLLGFLPLESMRAGTDPAFAAGCGQFMLVRATDYFACGGHSEIKLTMHDGLRLPKLFREHGFRTDLADLTKLATCRMYTSAGQVWNGLAKNAGEGLGSPGRIVPVTILLLLGQVFPFLLAFYLLLFVLPMTAIMLGAFGVGFFVTHPIAACIELVCFLLAALAGWVVRGAGARRFQQDWRSALLHPFGILLLLGVQWYALVRKLLGRAVTWRDRDYVAESE